MCVETELIVLLILLHFRKGKKGFDRFYLAVPARADHGAEVWIYTIQG